MTRTKIKIGKLYLILCPPPSPSLSNYIPLATPPPPLPLHPPSNLSKSPWTSLTAPFLSNRAASHVPSACIASSRRRDWRSSSERRVCSWVGVGVWVGGWVGSWVVVGWGWGGRPDSRNPAKKISTPGKSVFLTLSTSAWICAIVLCSVLVSLSFSLSLAFCW